MREAIIPSSEDFLDWEEQQALMRERDALRIAVRELLPYADNHTDEGPFDEGWQSDELIALIERAKKLIRSVNL